MTVQSDPWPASWRVTIAACMLLLSIACGSGPGNAPGNADARDSGASAAAKSERRDASPPAEDTCDDEALGMIAQRALPEPPRVLPLTDKARAFEEAEARLRAEVSREIRMACPGMLGALADQMKEMYETAHDADSRTEQLSRGFSKEHLEARARRRNEVCPNYAQVLAEVRASGSRDGLASACKLDRFGLYPDLVPRWGRRLPYDLTDFEVLVFLRDAGVAEGLAEEVVRQLGWVLIGPASLSPTESGPALEARSLEKLAQIDVPPSTKMKYEKNRVGEFVTLRITHPETDEFELHIESGSSCSRGVPGFDPEFPGTQAGLIDGAAVEQVLLDEGTEAGNRGAARYTKDGRSFMVFAECNDALGLACVTYEATEEQVVVAARTCASLRQA